MTFITAPIQQHDISQDSIEPYLIMDVEHSFLPSKYCFNNKNKEFWLLTEKCKDKKFDFSLDILGIIVFFVAVIVLFKTRAKWISYARTSAQRIGLVFLAIDVPILVYLRVSDMQHFRDWIIGASFLITGSIAYSGLWNRFLSWIKHGNRHKT